MWLYIHNCKRLVEITSVSIMLSRYCACIMKCESRKNKIKPEVKLDVNSSWTIDIFSAGYWHETGRFVTLIPKPATRSYPEPLISSYLSQHDPRYISIIPLIYTHIFQVGTSLEGSQPNCFLRFLLPMRAACPEQSRIFSAVEPVLKLYSHLKFLDAFRRRHR